MQPPWPGSVAVCNPLSRVSPPAPRQSASSRLARRVLLLSAESGEEKKKTRLTEIKQPVSAAATRTNHTMKDLLYIGATIAFFAVSWLYAKSFDHL
jgi:hypothetical protein